jgi:hypothetical protein
MGVNIMNRLALNTSLGLITSAVVGLGLVNAPVHGQSSATHLGYPAPSYPNIPNPKTIEEIMPFARAAARNESGFTGYGFGEVKAGEKVVIVTQSTDDESEMYIEAILRALREREITPIRMSDYEIMGVSREDARALAEAIGSLGLTQTSEQGWAEACGYFSENRWKAREYLKENHPDLFDRCNPPGIAEQLSPELLEIYMTMQRSRSVIPGYINEYIAEHPDVRGVFYGRGGPTWQSFAPRSDNWLGVFTFDNRAEAVSPMVSFPADVWLMVDEKILEPAAAVDKITNTDPEGTDVWWDLSEEQAQKWAGSMYLRGHIFMFAQQGFGSRGGASNVRYPAQEPIWFPMEPVVRLNGTVAGHGSHSGIFPRVEAVWENGYLQEIRGGGLYGDLMRALYEIPEMHTEIWPLRTDPGYFWHFETAVATNPKGLRPDITQSRLAAERMRGGVMHWALGSQVRNDEDAEHHHIPTRLNPEFEKRVGLAASHGFHIHTYFNTFKVHIRGSDRWLTLFDKGRPTGLDDPEVRALASRYGDPDSILATEWTPEIPGINVPGDYEAYSADPWPYQKAIQERINAGTYNTYNPYNPYRESSAD